MTFKAIKKTTFLATAPRKAVLIVWEDHSEPNNKDTWDTATPAKELIPFVIFTTGFIMNENADVIEIARDLSEDDQAGAFIHILKKCVVRRQEIKIPVIKKVTPKA